MKLRYSVASVFIMALLVLSIACTTSADQTTDTTVTETATIAPSTETGTIAPATTDAPTETATETATVHKPDFADEMTENLMQALNTGDYEAFSRDFSDVMLKAMTKELFEQTKASINNIFGEYVSKAYLTTELHVQNLYTVVTYQAVFTKQPDVTVQVTFLETGEAVLIYGLYFP